MEFDFETVWQKLIHRKRISDPYPAKGLLEFVLSRLHYLEVYHNNPGLSSDELAKMLKTDRKNISYLFREAKIFSLANVVSIKKEALTLYSEIVRDPRKEGLIKMVLEEYLILTECL